MIENQAPARRFGQRHRHGGGGDQRLFVEQLVKAAGGSCTAHQIAIGFRQRAKRTRHQHTRQNKRGNRSAADLAGSDADRALPQQHGDRSEDQEHDHRGHHRADADAAFGGVERGLDRLFKPRSLTLFLIECLHHLHRTEHFGHHCADIGDPVLTATRNIAQPPPEPDNRQYDQGDGNEQLRGQPGRKVKQIGSADHADQQIAQRHRYGGADHHFDQRGVRCHARGNFGRAVRFKEAGRHSQQIGLNLLADIADHALAEPRDVIKPERGADAKDDDHHQHQFEGVINFRNLRFRRETFVDNFLEPARDIACRRRCGDQCGQGDRQMSRIIKCLAPDHPQRAKTARRLGLLGDGGRRIVWDYDRNEIGCDGLAVHSRAN